MRFDVKLLPCGLRAMVIAPNVVRAAESLRVLSPANEAIVNRVGQSETALSDLVVGFGRRECCVHFIGFRGEEYHSAVRLWGLPDVYHRRWDQRAQREIGPGDLLIFARGTPADPPSPYNFDDSNEPDDPAAHERLRPMPNPSPLWRRWHEVSDG